MSNKELLFSVTIKDCKVQTFRSGGPGGQNQNKVSSGVRVIHEASGAKGESRETRSQHENKKRAFVRMAESDKFKLWQRFESARRMGILRDVEVKVDREMLKVRVEYREDGKWQEQLTEKYEND